MPPFRYQLDISFIHQAAPAIDRLSSLEETDHYIYRAAR